MFAVRNLISATAVCAPPVATVSTKRVSITLAGSGQVSNAVWPIIASFTAFSSAFRRAQVQEHLSGCSSPTLFFILPQLGCLFNLVMDNGRHEKEHCQGCFHSFKGRVMGPMRSLILTDNALGALTKSPEVREKSMTLFPFHLVVVPERNKRD